MNENRMDELNRALADIWDSLTDEQKEKAKNCETPEALIELASKEGIELPDEVFSAVAGGYISPRWFNARPCYEAVRDDNGKKLGICLTKEQAEEVARKNGQSTQEIDYNKVKELRKAAGGC